MNGGNNLTRFHSEIILSTLMLPNMTLNTHTQKPTPEEEREGGSLGLSLGPTMSEGPRFCVKELSVWPMNLHKLKFHIHLIVIHG